MKVAVIGAGSTYTPELVSGLSRARRIDAELALHDIDPDRSEVVGAMAARMLKRQGFSGSLSSTADLDRALDGADFVLVQIRVGGQPLDCRTRRFRSRAAASGRRPRVRAGSRRRCGRCRSCSRSPSACGSGRLPVPGSSTSRTRSASSPGRCSMPGTRNRALQRRDRVPAPPRGVARRCAGGCVVDQVGLNHLTWVEPFARRRRRATGAPRGARRRARGRGGPAAPAARPARRDPVVLPPLLLRARHRAGEQLAGVSPALRPWPTSSGICSSSTVIPLSTRSRRCSSSGEGLSTARLRPASSRRSAGSEDVHEVDIRNNGILRRARRRRRRRGARQVEGGVPVPLPQAPLAASSSGYAARCRVRATCTCRRAQR